jgi:hypothetical protein
MKVLSVITAQIIWHSNLGRTNLGNPVRKDHWLSDRLYMDHGYLPRQSTALQTVAMRPPQSINQPFSFRLFSTFTITLLVTLLSLSARGVAQQVTCTPAILQFGTVAVGQTETQLVTLKNTGDTDITVSATNLSTAEFSLSQLSLPLILSAGESVNLSVTFAPTATEWTGGRVTFTSNASNPSLLLKLGGIGMTSDPITASPKSISFGPVAVGTSSTKSVVLTNIRSWGKTISALQTAGSEFSVSGPSLPLTLNRGQSVTLNVTFTPQAAGLVGGSVFVAGPGMDENVVFTGTGTAAAAPAPAPGQLTITPATLNFGSIPDGTTATQSISLSAVGSNVTISSSASSSSQFVLNGASFPLTIATGQSVSFNVAFTPQSSGTVSGSLSFASNASNSGTPESLTGVGTVTQYSVNLSWNASSDVMGYNVYRSTAAKGTYSKINSSVNPNTAYTDSTVISGQTYYYAATSVNSSGQESALSTPPVAAAVP